MNRASDPAAATEHTRHFRVPIRTFLIAGFGGLVLLAVALVMILGFTSAAQNTRELLQDKVEGLLDEMVERIESDLRPVESQARWFADAMDAGYLSPLDEKGFTFAINASMAATPQSLGTVVISPQGIGRLHERGRLTPMIRDWSADPRFATTLPETRAQKGPKWGVPTYTEDAKRVIVYIQTPLRRDGKLVAILAQAVTVSRLSHELSNRLRQERGTPFILYGRDRVLAHPLLIDFPWPEETGAQPLPRLDELGDGVLPAIWNADEVLTPMLEGAANTEAVRVVLGGEHHIFIFRRLEGFGPEPWIVGIHFPALALVPQARRFFEALLAGVVVLALALVAAFVVGKRASRPIQRLAVEAAKVRGGNLAAVEPLGQSMFSEMDDAAHSFNGMVEGLRERDTIRDLFGKYVPERVAAEVLREGGELAAQSVEATVLFTDLEGFTSISETLSPVEVVEMLNRYFSILVGIVERHDGVVTQFQGDAILAVFNVPIARQDHAQAAVQAAVEIRETVAAGPIEGHELACRVGVNTGLVVAGNVGAEGRLHYTVNGDAVNLAARLETLNKDYGTRVMISQTTADRINGFELRRLGDVTVKGKREAVTVYAVE